MVHDLVLFKSTAHLDPSVKCRFRRLSAGFHLLDLFFLFLAPVFQRPRGPNDQKKLIPIEIFDLD